MIATSPATARRSGTATLAVISAAQFLIALDYSIIYVALPSIAHDLRLDAASGQWVVSAYAVLFAGFLVVGGRVSDRIGARRLFVFAVLGFGAASAVGGAAGSGALLLAARGVQGLFAALLQPAVLGLIGTTFPAGPRRSRALAVWGTVGASGLATGVLVGGLLTGLSWRLTFFINVPLTVLAALGAAGPRDGGTAAARIPLRGAVLCTGSVLGLVLGLTLAAERGLASRAVLGVLGLAAVLFLAFVLGERGVPLIDPGLRRTSSLRAGAAAAALYMASVGSEFYLLTLLLQTLKGYSAPVAGLAFLPLALMVTAGNSLAGVAVRRIGPAPVLAAGFVLATAGLFWLALALPGRSYVDLLAGILLSGFGHGVIYVSMFVIGTRDVPENHQGTAGALLTTAQYLSGAVTIAVLTLVLGTDPDGAHFRTAFLVTATAALAGGILATRDALIDNG